MRKATITKRNCPINTAPATQNDTPHTTDLHQMLRLPRKRHSHDVPRLPCHGHHLTQPWHCDSQKTRNTTHLKCCACHAKRPWTCPKCCTCHQKCKSPSEALSKVLRLSHKTTVDALSDTWDVTKCHSCHGKRHYNPFETFRLKVLAFPIGTTTQQETRESRRDTLEKLKTSIFTRLPTIFTLCSYKIEVSLRVWMKPQILLGYLKIDVWCEASVNFHHTCQKTQCLPRSRKLHIDTTWYSPDNAIRRKHETDRNSTDTYKVPRKTKIDTSTVLRLPRHMIHMEVIC